MMPSVGRRFPHFLIPLLLLVAVVKALPPNAPSASVVRSRIRFLASDALKGRESGTPGNDRAARFIADDFRRDGLQPLGTSRQGDPRAPMDGSGYFQPFTFTAGVAKGAANSLTAVIGGKPVKYRAGAEFEPCGASACGSVSGDVVFAGYGIQSKQPARDDYSGVNVRGKVALVLAGAPGADPRNLPRYAGVRAKAAVARDHGAVGLVVAMALPNQTPTFDSRESGRNEGLPVLLVGRRVAEEWVAAGGRNLEDVVRQLPERPAPFDTGVRANLRTEVHKLTRTTANIACLLRGSDPVPRSQVVVVGAHMDHLGMGGLGSLAVGGEPAIHPGADDDASGTAGVMALADAFSARNQRPKRSVLFICFSGEELGLLGSRYYVNHPLLPLARTTAMLNMDMIGRLRDDRLIVIGSGTSRAWNRLLSNCVRGSGLTLARSEIGFGNSDQQSFYDARIPVLFLFTGTHEDYHRPSDTADRINAEGEAKVLRFAEACIERMADRPQRPAYQKVKLVGGGPRLRLRVSLGSIPDYASDVEGVMLSGVMPGSPAEKASIAKGDIVVKLGERSVRSIQDYMLALSEHQPGDTVPIVVKRGTQTLTLTATLASPRGQR